MTTETLIQEIASFVAPMGWMAVLHSESPGGISVRLVHVSDGISHGAWITDEEIASGAWHEKVLFVVQPPKPAEAPLAPVDEPPGGRWVDPGPQAPVQPASPVPAQPLAQAPPALTMADILAKLEPVSYTHLTLPTNREV